MAQALETSGTSNREVATRAEQEEFVTFTIDKQLFGVPILKVQDILKPNRIAPVPLAAPEIRGSINLRGRIVTVIDVRVRLGLPANQNAEESMGVTVELHQDLYTLLVDSIGDVMTLELNKLEQNPGTLDPKWREFTNGIYRLEDNLMVVLDIDKLLDI
jgi:purine-binding chemotaxis protein CheW